ncbi:MAG: hypothetical protein Q4D60_01295 [Eubacteriales bacterium]|nr:hypothetical protein [Eubacteriales bacterium]
MAKTERKIPLTGEASYSGILHRLQVCEIVLDFEPTPIYFRRRREEKCLRKKVK